jgi:hypothetical protein
MNDMLRRPVLSFTGFQPMNDMLRRPVLSFTGFQPMNDITCLMRV